jgi:hypothetical protein
LRNVFDRPEYAEVRKELERELERLRKDLRVTENDPPASLIRPGPAAKKAAAKKKAAAR